jgi:hypothetical protein
MAFYYLILRFWLLMGKTEGFIRGLSALMSVATVPALYALGKRLFGPATGLLAAWLLALSAFHIRYAQEARGYALVVLTATIATWLFVRNLQEPSTAHWNAYALVGALTVYSHFYGALVFFSHFLSLFLLGREKIAWRRILWSYGLFGTLVAPVAIFTLRKGTGGISWIPEVDVATLIRFGEMFSGNYGLALLILCVLMVGVAAYSTIRIGKAHRDPAEGWGYRMVFLWLIAPFAIVLGVSLRQPIFFPRYMSPCLPALILLVASGIILLRPAGLGWALGIAISACSILGAAANYRANIDSITQDWRGASQYILRSAQPGDSVFFYPPAMQTAFEFYKWQAQKAPVWPVTLNPPTESKYPSQNLLVIPGTTLLSNGMPAGRVWLVHLIISNPSGLPDFEILATRDWIAQGRHRIDAQRRYFPIDVVLFEKNLTPQDTAAVASPGPQERARLLAPKIGR